jgi:hypothetical protein
MTEPDWEALGTEFIDPETQISGAKRMERELEEAKRNHEHFWVAIVSFKVTPPLLDGAVLDHENMLGPPAIGCYICEAVFTKLMARKCPGEPMEGPYDG